jgi:hypothetical protein
VAPITASRAVGQLPWDCAYVSTPTRKCQPGLSFNDSSTIRTARSRNSSVFFRGHSKIGAVSALADSGGSVACPTCVGEAWIERIAPNYVECRRSRDVAIVVGQRPMQGWAPLGPGGRLVLAVVGFEPINGVKTVVDSVRHHVPVPFELPKCSCGTYAIGECAGCGVPVCGDDSKRVKGRRLCQSCAIPRRSPGTRLPEPADNSGSQLTPYQRLVRAEAAVELAEAAEHRGDSEEAASLREEALRLRS